MGERITFDEVKVNEIVGASWPDRTISAKAIAEHLNKLNITRPSGLEWTAVGISQYAIGRLRLARRRVSKKFRAKEARKLARANGTTAGQVSQLTQPSSDEIVLQDIGQLLMSNMDHAAKLRILHLVVGK